MRMKELSHHSPPFPLSLSKRLERHDRDGRRLDRPPDATPGAMERRRLRSFPPHLDLARFPPHPLCGARGDVCEASAGDRRATAFGWSEFYFDAAFGLAGPEGGRGVLDAGGGGEEGMEGGQGCCYVSWT